MDVLQPKGGCLGPENLHSGREIRNINVVEKRGDGKGKDNSGTPPSAVSGSVMVGREREAEGLRFYMIGQGLEMLLRIREAGGEGERGNCILLAQLAAADHGYPITPAVVDVLKVYRQSTRASGRKELEEAGQGMMCVRDRASGYCTSLSLFVPPLCRW